MQKNQREDDFYTFEENNPQNTSEYEDYEMSSFEEDGYFKGSFLKVLTDFSPKKLKDRKYDRSMLWSKIHYKAWMKFTTEL